MRCAIYWISALALCLALGCGGDGRDVLTVIHAGSLTVPMSRMEAEFEASHPDVDVRRIVHGSATAIRRVTELGTRADVVASADYHLIDRMMIDADPAWASWNLLFARNEMCLAVSPHADDLKSSGWVDILRKPGVRIGISDPNRDPCGYRALMTLALAQVALGEAGLFDDIVTGSSNIKVTGSDGEATIRIPAAFEFAPRGRLVMRQKESELVPLLQVGAIDCAFIYRSMAVQQDAPFVPLPPEINLGDPERDKAYGRVRVVLADGSPDAVTVLGSAIVYSVTIPTGAPRPDLGRQFVRFIQSQEGRAILHDCGQEPLADGLYSGPGRPGA